MTRTYQQIQSRYWEGAKRKGLQPDEILVELYLTTNQACGPSGALIAASSTIAYYSGIPDSNGDTDLFGNNRVEKALLGLQAQNRIMLFSGGWIWVIGKWEYETTRSEQVQKAVVSELTSAPDALVQAFFDRYPDSITDRLKVSLTDRLKVSLTLDLTVDLPPIVIAEPIPIPNKKEKSIESEFNATLIEFADKIIPGKKSKQALRKQVAALDKLIRLDREKITPEMSPGLWELEVYEVLKAMRADTEVRGTWKGWSSVFNSIPRLRENNCEKYRNARSWFLSSLIQEEDSNQHLPKYVDHEACDREEREVNERIARENREDEQRQLKNTTA